MSDVISFEKYHSVKGRSNEKPRKNIGVIIRAPGSEKSVAFIGGNVTAELPSFIAFHAEFNPSLFGRQLRAEKGVVLVLDDDDDNPDPTPPMVA